MTTTNVDVHSLPVSLSEALQMILLYGSEMTLLMDGETGIGKSSLLPAIAKKHGDQWRKPGQYFATDKYNYLYIDCTTEEIGDRKMKIPVHATKKLEDYLAAEWRLDEGKPLVLMLDEFKKCPKALQVLWSRLMQERTIGNVPLPEGSIVFGTSNLASDGLGDIIKAHEANRVMRVHVRKSNSKEMYKYAAEQGVEQVLLAWIASTKQAFASYLDGNQDSNPYIFHPNRSGQCVTPRSTMRCNYVLQKRHLVPEHITHTALAGLIGRAGADSLMACVNLDDKVMKTEQVIKAPTAVPVPDDALALILMMIHGAADVETQDEVDAFMQFVDRVPSSEVQSIFFHMLVTSNNPQKVILVRNNKRLTQWRTDNYELI